ncbi:MAG: hypothetical protein ACMG6E_04475 [Candidatus Roizmanbacteria bacterium]
MENKQTLEMNVNFSLAQIKIKNKNQINSHSKNISNALSSNYSNLPYQLTYHE